MYRRLYQPGGHKEEKITQTVATQLFHDMHFIQGIINALDTAWNFTIPYKVEVRKTMEQGDYPWKRGDNPHLLMEGNVFYIKTPSQPHFGTE